MDSLSFEDADFGQLASAVGDSEAKDFELGHEERGPCSIGGRNCFRGGVVVGVGLANDINGSLAAGDVEAFVLGVEKEVVGVTGNWKAGDQGTGSVVVNQEASGVAAAGEKAVVGFVQ